MQRFKLNIANSVVTQQNAGLESMDTDLVLDLFKHTSEEDEAMTRGWQTPMFGSLMIVFYSHVILSITGYIAPTDVHVRIVQASIAILYYCYRLNKASQSDGFKED